MNFTDLLGTTTISAAKDIINSNFATAEDILNDFVSIYDDVSGNIDLTSGANGILKAKKLEIPLGNIGIIVGNTTVTDSAISTTTVTNAVTNFTATSIQYTSYATNRTSGGSGIINVANTASTFVLDPTQPALQFEISASGSNKMRDLLVVNLSQAGESTQLNITNVFVENGSVTSVTIPPKKSVLLRYINDTNTNTQGWSIVCNNGATIV
jgi:hypothetical protein